jgi:SAM-dependent methyltransferase
MKGHAPTTKIQSYKVTGQQLKKILPQYTAEQRKYQKCWKLDAYRKVSPGERLVDLFIETANPKEGETIVDWGCGTGRAGKKLSEHGLDVTLVDFAFNCLDDDVKQSLSNGLRFVEHDISIRRDFPSTYGFCTDVLEHIPEDQIDQVIDNILENSRHVFFQISTVHDAFGCHPQIDDDLHLTVHPYQWWLEKFVSKKVIIHHSNDLGNAAIFYLTGWGKVNLAGKGSVNISHEQIIENMKANAEHGIQPVKPYEQQETEIILLAGGPSLNDFEDEILEYRRQGMKLVTVNGSYTWAIDRGFSPSLQLIIDGREHNKRFTKQVVGLTEETKYICASQCDPGIFESLPKDRTYMWQVSIDDSLIPHIKEHYGEMYKDWFPCPGGSTVTTRALCLLMMLGYYKFHIYGFDSCLFEGLGHHAYDQPENDHHKPMEIIVGKGMPYERKFLCHPWHVFQAKDFEQMVPRVLKDAKLDVKGNGLIAYMINSAAGIMDNIVTKPV